MKEDGKVFALRLTEARTEKGIKQKDAAEALGLSQALLSHYENGVREPGLAFVRRACDYYRVSADYLLGRTLDRSAAVDARHRPHRSCGHREHDDRSGR